MRVAEQVRHDDLALLSGQRLERDQLRTVARRPFGTALHELAAGGADDQRRRVLRRVEDVLERVEEHRFGPLDVVDDDDEVAAPGEDLDELPRRPDELRRRELITRQPDRGREALDDARSVLADEELELRPSIAARFPLLDPRGA